MLSQRRHHYSVLHYKVRNRHLRETIGAIRLGSEYPSELGDLRNRNLHVMYEVSEKIEVG